MQKYKHMKKIVISFVAIVLLLSGALMSSETNILAPEKTTQTISDTNNQPTTPDQNETHKQMPDNNQTEEQSTPDSTNPPRTSWTEWDETLYPDFYRDVGPAVIDYELPKSEIQYSQLDSLGRTQSVYAHLDSSNYEYGKRDRESISHIYPSGWNNNQKVSLHFANGKTYNGYFYNRSHLLAHSLGGSDEKDNLITGTRTQNVGQNNMEGGIQYCEMIASRYLTNNPNSSIYYFVTPLYYGDELVPRSIIVDMKSEDSSIDKEVETFNVAPGYTIDYATGSYCAQ